MLIDLAKNPPADPVDCDVAVVGAGTAGVALARSLAQRGRNVCLMEAGGLDYDQHTQDIAAGRNIGMEYYELDHARLRFFGGTTNIWGGRCVPLDPIDFEQRDWVPHSGWPIAVEDLEPWYRLAHDSLDLGDYDYSDANWRTVGEQPFAFSEEEISTRFWRFDAMEERFNSTQAQDLVSSETTRVYIHANLVQIQAATSKDSVSELRFRSLSDTGMTVRARHYVLACGAIENARLLLMSRDVESDGIGNRHDQVGRYFMEHPHGRIARARTRDPAAMWALYRKRYPLSGPPLAPALVAGEALQRNRGVLNSACTIKLGRPPELGLAVGKKIYMNMKHDLSPSRSGRRLWHFYKRILDWLQRHLSMALLRHAVKWRGLEVQLMARAEQAPNPESRVLLSDQTDALGCPRADLDWQMTELDKRSVRELGEAMAREFTRLGLGDVEICDWLREDDPAWPVDPTVGNHPIGGYHHMGTTRMSESAEQGVVDRNCTVHGYDNLHIAGSSVFPTGGWANPTLTILALSHRLAAHIEDQLAADSPA